MSTTAATKSNGIDMKQMIETVEVLKQDPALARFQFRNRNTWISGGENKSIIKDLYGAGQEDRRPGPSSCPAPRRWEPCPPGQAHKSVSCRGRPERRY